jgi:hypothetical protein
MIGANPAAWLALPHLPQTLCPTAMTCPHPLQNMGPSSLQKSIHRKITMIDTMLMPILFELF